MPTILSIRSIAEDKYKSGYNCAESVVAALAEAYPDKFPADMVSLASAFGGGIGSGCVCGALAGSVLLLNKCIGRTQPTSQPKEPVYDAARQLHDLFKTKFTSTCCCNIKQSEFAQGGGHSNCLLVTALATELIAQFLADKGFIRLD